MVEFFYNFCVYLLDDKYFSSLNANSCIEGPLLTLQSIWRKQEFVRKDKRFQHKDKGPYSNGNDLVPKPFKKKLALGEVFCYGVKISKFVV